MAIRVALVKRDAEIVLSLPGCCVKQACSLPNTVSCVLYRFLPKHVCYLPLTCASTNHAGPLLVSRATMS